MLDADETPRPCIGDPAYEEKGYIEFRDSIRVRPRGPVSENWHTKRWGTVS